MSIQGQGDAMTAQIVVKRADGRSILDTNKAITAQTLKDLAVEPERMEAARRRLEGLGFKVGVGDATGLSVQGPVERFRTVFAVGPDDVERDADIPDDLADLIAGVVVPRAPEFFP